MSEESKLEPGSWIINLVQTEMGWTYEFIGTCLKVYGREYCHTAIEARESAEAIQEIHYAKLKEAFLKAEREFNSKLS